MNLELLHATLANARQALLAARSPHGYWVGELSTSALSTATALFTLSLYQRRTGSTQYTSHILGGLEWLANNINADGGWGDTTKSFSNLSTTCLGWAAFAIPEAEQYQIVAKRAEAWIIKNANSLEPASLAWAVAERYGLDRTFSVPILTMMALAGRLGDGDDPWRYIPQLPFEFAALPFWCFQLISLPVVSYALPALIAMGQVRHHHRPTWNPITNPLRWWFKKRTLRKLREIQPTTGGYLEATPLTSFVCMSLIGANQHDDPVVTEGLKFLVDSVRPDGSWPIDTNLSTWVTTLSINALGECPGDVESVKEWLLNQQYRTTHPYTMAKPGGWAWTNLSGGVPDADDTPSALLALRLLTRNDLLARSASEGTENKDPRLRVGLTRKDLDAAEAGVTWLIDLQNTDGGIPTFCRGWGTLPFDRSSNDLTAHALRAWAAWYDDMNPKLQKRIERGWKNGLNYLLKQQRPDGAWAPLWFGNQHADEVANLTYGTSRVLVGFASPAVRKMVGNSHPTEAIRKAEQLLVQSQNADGGWGGRPGTPSSIEETALAIEALVTSTQYESHLTRGLEFLASATQLGTYFPPSPIGFYFANLWYYETLYPTIFTVAALTKMAKVNA